MTKPLLIAATGVAMSLTSNLILADDACTQKVSELTLRVQSSTLDSTVNAQATQMLEVLAQDCSTGASISDVAILIEEIEALTGGAE